MKLAVLPTEVSTPEQKNRICSAIGEKLPHAPVCVPPRK